MAAAWSARIRFIRSASWASRTSTCLNRLQILPSRPSSSRPLSPSALSLLPHLRVQAEPHPLAIATGNAGDDAFRKFQTNRISTTSITCSSAATCEDDSKHSLRGESSGNSNYTPHNSNSVPFLLADIGEGISEVELLQWFVTPGDTVSQFDRICEVQSDKASVEITSRFDGVVEILCGQVGDMMLVGKPLLYIGKAGGDTIVSSVGGSDGVDGADANATQNEMVQNTTLHNVDDEQDRLNIPSVGVNYSTYYSHEEDGNILHGTESVNASKVLTSPAVRKLGKEHNIDLATIYGSGPGGRVLKADVLKMMRSKGIVIEKKSPSVGSPKEEVPATALDSTFPDANSSHQGEKTVPIRGYHRQMVKSMATSLQVPHMVYADEINVDSLTSVRDSLRPLAQEAGVNKLTYLPFFVKAASLALTQYPILNSTIDADKMEITYHEEHNIGVAVDTDRGLTVPVVKRCQERSVLDIALELGRLYSLAIEGNLSESDISKPTFTLSNIGAIGGTYMSPVVLPPQVAIGAMGKIQRLPRFTSETSSEVKATRIMPISWGGDHRAVDGATMARFSNLWKGYCENPSRMMFAMR